MSIAGTVPYRTVQNDTNRGYLLLGNRALPSCRILSLSIAVSRVSKIIECNCVLFEYLSYPILPLDRSVRYGSGVARASDCPLVLVIDIIVSRSMTCYALKRLYHAVSMPH